MESAIKDFDGKLSLTAKEMQDYVSGDHGLKDYYYFKVYFQI